MAKKWWWLVVMMGMVALGFMGCTTFKASGFQMGLATNGQKYEKVEDFSEAEWTNRFLGWGTSGGTLFNLSSNAADSEVRDAVTKNIKKYDGDAVINMEIKYSHNPLQWLCRLITAGIWMPGTVTVKGTVVKAVDAAPAASSPPAEGE